jgi:hypothetical protein
MRSDTEPVPAEVYLGQEDEAVDGEPVLEDGSGALAPVAAELATLAAAASPAVQAAAAAATGFVAGVATLAIARRRSTRRLARTAGHRRRGDAVPILGTRSFLIDIHMIRPPG